MDFTAQIENYVQTLRQTLESLDKNEINKFVHILKDGYEREKNIYIFGNGGSALNACHFACDINKCVPGSDDRRFKIITLSDNIASVTACANDFGYENVFLNQLKNFLREGDIVIGISGSGNSTNVLKAIEYANSIKDVTTVGLTGYDGGKLRDIVNHSINTNINDMQISEDIHLILSHILMKIIPYAVDSFGNSQEQQNTSEMIKTL